MPKITTRPIVADDLTDTLAVQQTCYDKGSLESGNVLINCWARSSAVCLVVLYGADVVEHLFSYAWHAWTPPKLHVSFPAPDAADVLWLVYDMAIALVGRGRHLGEQPYATVSAGAHA